VRAGVGLAIFVPPAHCDAAVRLKSELMVPPHGRCCGLLLLLLLLLMQL
jgi:hypothetical protein